MYMKVIKQYQCDNYDKLEKIGHRWTKYDFDRFYFNPKELKIMKLSYYNTGNIFSASYNGESVSNSFARRVVNDLEGKFYLDIVTGKLYGPKGNYFNDDIMQKVDEALMSKEETMETK